MPQNPTETQKKTKNNEKKSLNKPDPERLKKLQEMESKAKEKLNKKKPDDFVSGNYFVTENGLYYDPTNTNNNDANLEESKQDNEKEKNSNKKDPNGPIWICSPIWPEAYLRTKDGTDHSLLLKVHDGEREHFWAMPKRLITKPNEINEVLLNLGQQVPIYPANQKHLLSFFNQARPSKMMRCVDKCGWHDEQYVFPDGEIIGEAENSENVYPLNKDIPKGFKQKGTHADWLKNVWELCTKNSRLIFSVGVALSAPCLFLTDEDSGGFSLVGPSSIGKSRCLLIAISVFGSPDFKRSWKNTSNGFEAICALHHDLLLPMDEGGQADPKEIGENIYMFSQGQGKGRMYKNTSARDSKDWRAMLLSTSERGLNDLMREGKKKPKPGQLVRIADIPAAANSAFGCFEDLHGHENGHDGEAFAEHIKAVCTQYYGSAGKEFVRAMIVHGIENTKEDLNNLSDDFAADVARNYDGQVKRVANRFGLVYAAISLGIKLKVLQGSVTDEMAKSAIKRCFLDWLGNRGTTGNMETHSLIRQVEGLLLENSEGKFVDASEYAEYAKDKKLRNSIWGCRDGTKYYVFCHAFTDYLCEGFEPDDATKMLINENILDPKVAGHQKKINGVNTRYYQLDLASINGAQNA